MLLYILAILTGFTLLIWSADRFVDGSIAIANYLGIPSLIVGMVIVGFGTSAPEMVVSGTAALSGNAGMGIGNAIGSNIANIGLVLGATALVTQLPVQSRIIRRDIPILIVAECVAYYLLAKDGFGRTDGIILLGGLILILGWMVYSTKKSSSHTLPPIEQTAATLPLDPSTQENDKKTMVWAVIGLILLLISSQILVYGASGVAEYFGISDLVIGLTIVAIGTSLPELAASITSALKGETDLAIGNIVGSNLFNILGVLALPALLAPGTPPIEAIYRDMPVMAALTFLLFIFILSNKKESLLTRWKGIILLSGFIAYTVLLYIQTSNTSCSSLLCLN